MTPRIPREVSHALGQKTKDNLVGICHKCQKPIWAWNVHLRDDAHNTIEHLGCADKADREKVQSFLSMMREAKIGEERYRQHLRDTGRMLGPDGEPIKEKS